MFPFARRFFIRPQNLSGMHLSCDECFIFPGGISHTASVASSNTTGCGPRCVCCPAGPRRPGGGQCVPGPRADDDGRLRPAEGEGVVAHGHGGGGGPPRPSGGPQAGPSSRSRGAACKPAGGHARRVFPFLSPRIPSSPTPSSISGFLGRPGVCGWLKRSCPRGPAPPFRCPREHRPGRPTQGPPTSHTRHWAPMKALASTPRANEIPLSVHISPRLSIRTVCVSFL